MTILEDIIAGVVSKASEREAKTPLEETKQKTAAAPQAKDVASALRDGPGAVSIIAEI